MARLRRRLGAAGLALSLLLAILVGYRALVQTAGPRPAGHPGADVRPPRARWAWGRPSSPSSRAPGG